MPDRFVAFIDISGFKELMKHENDDALNVLRRFYQIGYRNLDPKIGKYDDEIRGIFVSDSGIIWTKNIVTKNEIRKKFNLFLKAVQDINQNVLDDFDMKKNQIRLKTSIAFGDFNFVETSNHELIEKNLIYGEAYLSAYKDNSSKLDPGLCRIVIDKKFPIEIKKIIDNNEFYCDLISFIKKFGVKYYFFWNCKNVKDIDIFWKRFQNAKKLVYQKQYEALEGF
jgi:hypothetical protein